MRAAWWNGRLFREVVPDEATVPPIQTLVTANAAVQLDHIGGPRGLVQAIHVLCDDRDLRIEALQPGNRDVSRVRLR